MLKFDRPFQHSGRQNENLAHLARHIFPSLPPCMRTTGENTDGLRDYIKMWCVYVCVCVYVCTCVCV